MSGKYCIGALELLVLSSGTKRLDELWGEMLIKFQSDPEFFSRICPNISTFEQFIRNQTALFKVHDGFVYLVDVWDSLNTQNQKNVVEKPKRWSNYIVNGYDQMKVLHGSDRSSGSISQNDHEAEVLEYFQMHLLKMPERLIPSKLLADCFIRSPPSIRAFIGHVSNIMTFLSKHPSHFHIQGDFVGLAYSRKRIESGPKQRRLSHPISPKISENHDGPSDFQLLAEVKKAPIDDTKSHSLETSRVVLSLNDCKAILWIMQQVKNNSIQVKELLTSVFTAPKVIQSCVGWTHIDLVEFLKKYPQFIRLSTSEEHIYLCDTSRLSIVAVTSRSESSDSHILLSHRGSIFCVEKLWGIIDLGFHEHVFFDKSLFKNVTDLTKHFKIKEAVYFNAQRASKESRARWRATCVWKETDQVSEDIYHIPHCAKETNLDTMEDSDSGLENSNQSDKARVMNCEDVQRKYFADIASIYDTFIDKFVALRVTEPWEVQTVLLESSNQSQDEGKKQVDWCNLPKTDDSVSGNQSRSSSSSSVSEMNTLSDVPSISAGILECHPQNIGKSTNYSDALYPVCRHFDDCDVGFNIDDLDFKRKDQTPKSVCTQTLFTGEIMATQLYHDNGTVN